nr:hypothetical protein [Mycoplasmopsis bovis]
MQYFITLLSPPNFLGAVKTFAKKDEIIGQFKSQKRCSVLIYKFQTRNTNSSYWIEKNEQVGQIAYIKDPDYN